MLLKSYFEKFVSNIEPSEERVQAVSAAHQALREHLMGEESGRYPIGDSFLAGSYARHTATDVIKDVDVILTLRHANVSSDRREPPPRAVLAEVKNAIDEFYDEVELIDQRRSIRVTLPEDKIRMDVVPAIAPRGKDERLYVPDRDQATWIESNPSAHAERATRLNAVTDGQFVRIVKAMKWWASHRLPKELAPKSILLETMLGEDPQKADSLVESFAGTVDGILSRYQYCRDARRLPRLADPGLPESDLAVSCGWSLEEFLFFYAELAKAHDLAARAIGAKSRAETVECWRLLLGEAYPATLSTDDERSIEATTDAALTSQPRKREYPHRVTISARLAPRREARAVEKYPNNGRKLPKEWWIEFHLDETDVPQPYDIKWAVRNHGAQARADTGLFHETFPGAAYQWERTRYRGHHFMDCEIWKAGTIVAKARHIVNIL